MSNRRPVLLACIHACFFILPVSTLLAQHDFERTKTVDHSGNADFTTIQAGISAVPDNSTDKWTVLVYAGVYTENITLDHVDENIDIVGVDGDSVIIQPTSDGPGIKITSGTETERNNSIRNLTIDTTTNNGGHGIEIVKGTGGGAQTPKNIAIDGVTIRAGGTNKNGIQGVDADTVRISNCHIDSANGYGLDAGDNFRVIGSTITALANGRRGINIESRRGLFVANCDIAGGLKGFHVGQLQSGNNCADIEVEDSIIRAINTSVDELTEGVSLYAPGDNIRFRNCLISSEGEKDPKGLYGDFPEEETTLYPVFDNCVIQAIGGTNSIAAKGVQMDNTDNVQLLNCTIRASCANTSSAAVRVYGVYCPSVAISIIGGSIAASAAGKKANDVYDLTGDGDSTPTADHIFVSGARFSKWFGPINASGGPQNITQTIKNIGLADNDAILTETALPPPGPDVPVDPTGQPDVYRALSVTGTVADMDQLVYIEGTNWAGDRIVEAIQLDGTTPVYGNRPFKSVIKIILPARVQFGEKVKIGTANRLGFYYPIRATSDVLQQARATSVNGVYAFETVGTVNEAYSTVDVGQSLQPGNNMQWMLLTAR